MEIVLLSVGKIREPWVRDGISLYTDRLKHYIPFRHIEIADAKINKKTEPAKQKEMEGAMMLKQIETSDHLILMDEHGREMTSTGFAAWIEGRMASGLKRLVLAIGGPYGFSEDVRRRANGLISMSQMTFTHEMARLFATEQIYRAMTILNHQPYHHE